MKKRIVPVFIVIVILLFSLVTLFIIPQTASEPPEPSKGMLDLSGWSFEEDGIVKLAGEWEFYFNRFLTHEDFEKGVDIAPVFVQIPSNKKSMAPSKPFAEDKYYGTMRLRIKLPEHTKVYGLRTDIILTAFQVYIDGQLYGEVGKVGNSPETSVPFYKIVSAYFYSNDDEVELIYHTSDFTAGDSTIAVPQIGLAAQIAQAGQWGLGRDLFLFGILLVMGIYHLGLYVVRPKDRAPAYFGVFCLLFSFRMLLVGERLLQSQFYGDFFVYGRIAYLCVFIGFASLCGFLYHTLDRLFPIWFIRAGKALGVSCGFLMLWVPYQWADTLLIVSAVPAFALMGYAIVRLVYGVCKRYPFANIVLLGFSFLGMTFVNDFIYQITLANTPSLIPLGICVFTFTQAYTLSARFSNACTRAEQLSMENKAILFEMKHVNSNLESLVAQRTSELQIALNEMEVMSRTDYLTKLPNRLLVLEKIEQLIAQEKSFYVAIVDIDHFKDINDKFGHAKGDEILIRLSAILLAAVGDCGFVGRWGGEEFLIVLETERAGTILKKADEIRLAVAGYRHEDIGNNLTITIGLCRYNAHSTIDTTIANADKALYQGKLDGRNQCRVSM